MKKIYTPEQKARTRAKIVDELRRHLPLTLLLEVASPPTSSYYYAKSAALFLASDESSYINGDVLMLDGGWNAG